MSEANLALARRGYEAMRQGDLGAAVELLHEDVRWHAGDPEAEGACHGRRQALDFMSRPGRAGLPELVDMIEAGEDRVLVILRPQDTEAPLRGQITTFRDGKVVEMVACVRSHSARIDRGRLRLAP